MMGNGQTDLISLAIFLAGLSLVPLLVVATTAFLKISLTLLVLRNAIGVQQVPPTLAIYGISLALTAFVMAPTLNETGKRLMDINSEWNFPTKGRAPPMLERVATAAEPMRKFMMKFSRPENRASFLDTAKRMWPPEYARDATQSDILILIPAFVVSEMQTGYEIAVLIYIPFVVIDLLVANILMALGMQQVSPQTIAIPLKLLLFVMVDGWAKLLHSLALSYI